MKKAQRGAPAKEQGSGVKIAKRMYALLDRRQKSGFLLIIAIMAISAALA